MKNYKGLLISAIEVVTFLLSAFGGFLTRIAPPDQAGTPFAVGIVSFLLLIALLLVSAIARQSGRTAKPRAWTVAGACCFAIAVPAVFLYASALDRYTYWYPPEQPLARRVQASQSDLTELAKDYILRNPNDASAAELERNLPSDQIWNKPAVDRINRLLLLTYLWLVMALATALFCLIEANSSGLKPAARAAVRSK